MMEGVSVIIITKNNPNKLNQFLSTFSETNNHLPIEIILFDHGTKGEVNKILSSYSSLVFIRLIKRETHSSILSSIYMGIQKSSYQYLYIADITIPYSRDIIPSALYRISKSNTIAIGVDIKDDVNCQNKYRCYKTMHALLVHKNSISNQIISTTNQYIAFLPEILFNIANTIGLSKIIIYDIKHCIQTKANYYYSNSKEKSNSLIKNDTPPNLNKPLVSVVMTAYNSEETISNSIESILNQSYSNIELIVVDDKSTDQSYAISKKYEKIDSRVIVYANSENRGTYWSKNYGITKCHGELLTFQDSDDTSKPERIYSQVKEFLNNHELVYCICNSIRVDKQRVKVSNSKLCYFSLMLKRKLILDRIGYFDSVRVSADSEFYERLKNVFLPQNKKHIPDVLCEQLYKEGSLTLCNDKALRIDFKNQPCSLPTDRKQYIVEFQKWHNKIRKERASPYISFPLGKRPFFAPESMAIDSTPVDKIIASVASMPSRKDNLKITISSIITQVDKLFVFLNNYDSIPEFLNHPNIIIAQSQDYGDLADNGKFFFNENIKNCIHFTIDDDILYPKDYIQKMCIALQKYKYRAIVGVHGVMLSEPLKSFYSNRTVYNFTSSLTQDEFVNLLGTGTICYHTSTLNLNSKDFKTTKMTDLWVAIKAKNQKIPMVCVAREDGWLKQQIVEEGKSIYLDLKFNDEQQVKLARGHSPWGLQGLVDFQAILSMFGDGNIYNMKKYGLAIPKKNIIDQPTFNSIDLMPKLNILFIGRFETWKKGGIHKSCKLIADLLIKRGHYVYTLDVLQPLPKINTSIDIAWIYPGDPNRPDYNSVDNKIRTLQEMGIPVIVNFSHIQKKNALCGLLIKLKNIILKRITSNFLCSILLFLF
jgi:glycosyltransferase involved in cell wall biosynthesis